MLAALDGEVVAVDEEVVDDVGSSGGVAEIGFLDAVDVLRAEAEKLLGAVEDAEERIAGETEGTGGIGRVALLEADAGVAGADSFRIAGLKVWT